MEEFHHIEPDKANKPRLLVLGYAGDGLFRPEIERISATQNAEVILVKDNNEDLFSKETDKPWRDHEEIPIYAIPMAKYKHRDYKVIDKIPCPAKSKIRGKFKRR